MTSTDVKKKIIRIISIFWISPMNKFWFRTGVEIRNRIKGWMETYPTSSTCRPGVPSRAGAGRQVQRRQSLLVRKREL